MDFHNPLFWLAAAVLVGVGIVLTRYWSPQARINRRRRKSNSRVVSTARKPTVKFSVHTEDDDK